MSPATLLGRIAAPATGRAPAGGIARLLAALVAPGGGERGASRSGFAFVRRLARPVAPPAPARSGRRAASGSSQPPRAAEPVPNGGAEDAGRRPDRRGSPDPGRADTTIPVIPGQRRALDRRPVDGSSAPAGGLGPSARRVALSAGDFASGGPSDPVVPPAPGASNGEAAGSGRGGPGASVRRDTGAIDGPGPGPGPGGGDGRSFTRDGRISGAAPSAGETSLNRPSPSAGDVDAVDRGRRGLYAPAHRRRCHEPGRAAGGSVPGVRSAHSRDVRPAVGDRARAWAELFRVSAVLSVPGDALAGAAARGLRPDRGTLLAVGASVCLYEAGMALNDWADRAEDAAERPHRPVPSGRIAPGAALAAATALTATGLALAARAGRPAAAVATALAATVWSYDLHWKHTRFGPAAMATARALDLLLGAAATGTRERRAPGSRAVPDPAASRPSAPRAVGRPAPGARAGSGAVPPPARPDVGGRSAAPSFAPAGGRLGSGVVPSSSRPGADGPPAVSRWSVPRPADRPLPGAGPGRVAVPFRPGAGGPAAARPSAPTGGRPGPGPARPRTTTADHPPRLSGQLPAVLRAAAVLAAHTCAVTAVSRHEVYGGSVRAPLGALAVVAGIAGAAAREGRAVPTALAVAYARTAAVPYAHAALNPSPPLTERAVGGGIRAVIPLQALLAARTGQPSGTVTALALMALPPAARALARRVSPT
ncbi:UbiA family prenyltransferase [Streptomyces sp. NPDC006798]|uniref:UbiA family prenyltransferase n=1 Tax=Streptomyces sp. NPDC006798 TaxID=3155462 RepID=UPI0034099B6C